MTDAHGVARDQLRAFIERIERLEEEKKTIADDIKDVYGEAKGFGYDTKAIRTIIRLRKKDANERAEEEAVLDAYMAALGMIDQHDLFHEAVATSVKQNTRSPAMALQSPRKAAEAVSERTAFTSATIAPVLVEADKAEAVAGVLGQPETIPALTVQHDGVNVGGPERAGVTVVGTESGTVANPEMDRATEGSFETGSEAAEKGRKAIPAGPEGVDLNHAGAGEIPVTNSKTDAAISRPGKPRPETENRSDEEPCEARGSGEMQDEIAIHLPTRSDGGLNIVHKHTQINGPEPDRSFLITPEEEKELTSVEAVTTAASGGAGASKVVCPALTDDDGGCRP